MTIKTEKNMINFEGNLLRFCKFGKEPIFSPYGYVIDGDGLIYSLIERCCHGVVLAFIFPKFAKDNGYNEPHRDLFNVFEYQEFELENCRDTDALSISMSSFDGQLNVRLNNSEIITPEQLKSLNKIFKIQGLKGKDKIQTDLHETTILKFNANYTRH